MVDRVVQANHNILKYHPLLHMTSLEAAKGEQRRRIVKSC